MVSDTRVPEQPKHARIFQILIRNGLIFNEVEIP